MQIVGNRYLTIPCDSCTTSYSTSSVPPALENAEIVASPESPTVEAAPSHPQQPTMQSAHPRPASSKSDADERTPESPTARPQPAAATSAPTIQSQHPSRTPQIARVSRNRWWNQRLHYFGKAVAARMSATTRSVSKPSSSASGRSTNRCRNTGTAACFTSSGIRKSRPSRAA